VEEALETLRIDTRRLIASLEELGRIGAYDVGEGDLRGVRRLTLTDEDKRGRDLVVGWFHEAGLAVRIDQIGNVFARRSGRDDTLAPVLVGSHIDSVPTAGRFDGCLGVLSGLEMIRTLNERKVVTECPLEVAFFTEEEGCRFGTDMLGSAVATGRIALEDAYRITDADGRTVGDELERIGYRGTEAVGTLEPHAYVECHIEQGPHLIRSGHDLGVVTGVQAISWQELHLQGRSAHAGTTPISYRADAGLVASLVNVRLRAMCDSGDYGEMRATMGVMKPHPGAVNVIPGHMQVSLDLRNPDDQAMIRAERDLRTQAEEIAVAHSVTLSWKQTARTAMVPFDAGVQDIIARTAGRFGLKQTRLISGAGHDAQEWARICPTAMIFVPGENDGISHNPHELSTPEQCGNGANVLLHTVLQLATSR
jgi:N-carbamoyl-L-amino-acid hydrolase